MLPFNETLIVYTAFWFCIGQNPPSTSDTFLSPSTCATSVPIMSDYTHLNTETLRKLVCAAVQESAAVGMFGD
jgi:hypothetical protein